MVDPFSWYSTENQVKELKQQLSATTSEPQRQNVNTEAAKEQSHLASAGNGNQIDAQSDARIIHDLKAEVATLKVSLDNLYKAHDGLVNDHNALLKYTTSIASPASSNKNVGVSSNVESRVTKLERELDEVCGGDIQSIIRLSSLQTRTELRRKD